MNMLALDSAAVDMSGAIDPDFFVLVHLNHSAVLNNKTYRAKTYGLQCITHQTFKLSVP